MASIYIAAAFGRRKEMIALARLLSAGGGHTITSRWIHREQKTTSAAEHIDAAFEDLEDIVRADVLVAVTQHHVGDPDWQYATGGRHVEFGFALGRGKRLVVFGPKENIFHYVHGVQHAESIRELVTLLDDHIEVSS